MNSSNIKLFIEISIAIVITIIIYSIIKRKYEGYDNKQLPNYISDSHCNLISDPYWRYYCFGARHL